MMKNVLPVKVDVPYGRKIGVFVSGGLDSAILLYIVWNICLKQGNQIKAFTMPKQDGAIEYSKKVVEWVRQHLIADHIDHVIVGDAENIECAISDIVEGKHAGFMYSAVTSYPEWMQPEHSRNVSQYEFLKQPFVNITKDVTVKMGLDLGLKELMSLTHSCTEDPIGKCGKCWWCQERAWAFEQNGEEDE